jgi:hypothetical protein
VGMKKDVISRKQLPTRGLPSVSTAVWLLVLDRLHAPGWVWGVAVTLLVLMWAGHIAAALWFENDREVVFK